MPNQIVGTLIEATVRAYAEQPEVGAVVLAGSQVSGDADLSSDIDLYVYVNSPLPISTRSEIARRLGRAPSVDNNFWEPGDDWQAKDAPISFDLMFRNPAWLREQLERVILRHEARLGYSTCVWYNVLKSHALYDPAGWFRDQQSWADQAYPEELRRAVVNKNFPALGSIRFSYIHQIETALARRDLVSVHHRVTAFLASYFDVLFAVNRLPHPGEKRLVAIAADSCQKLPLGMMADVDDLCSAPPGPAAGIIARQLEQRLRRLLRQEGLV